ncbi:MAG TPA: ferric reductase-like transmembrane domain-containing protein [Slackia equolifaciens]|uniref:Ferric reductase-like transmembrane domain-containing protein n=1 Tax=Slackia equolifaciens TaxID=498718 RepID=A0A9D3A1G6_9ACTN|nr:ferric reductase-like transmembrane domain-containing protein [Slackia equolifaciens]
MEFLLVFVVTVAAALALREPLKRCPVAFYALACAVVFVFLAGANGLLSGGWWKPSIVLVQRCMVALSLFSVVMLIGALPKGSKLDAWLRPVRAELSIVACILCLGHMCMYLAPYAARAVAGTMGAPMLVSFVVAVVLFVLVLVLGVTSFGFVKKRMGGRAWKNVQRLAYPFFGLAWVHLMFMLAPAASKGGEQALLSVVIYTVLFSVYIVLRLFRAYRDKRAGLSSA